MEYVVGADGVVERPALDEEEGGARGDGVEADEEAERGAGHVLQAQVVHHHHQLHHLASH